MAWSTVRGGILVALASGSMALGGVWLGSKQPVGLAAACRTTPIQSLQTTLPVRVPGWQLPRPAIH